MIGFTEGETYSVVYPFVRCKATQWDNDGCHEFDSWRPGTENAFVPPDDCEAIAHANGIMLLTVVSIHKPGRFPTRVFYTREWETPEGKRFGKPRLHIATIEKFRRLCRSYQHPYRVFDTQKAAA